MDRSLGEDSHRGRRLWGGCHRAGPHTPHTKAENARGLSATHASKSWPNTEPWFTGGNLADVRCDPRPTQPSS